MKKRLVICFAILAICCMSLQVQAADKDDRANSWEFGTGIGFATGYYSAFDWGLRTEYNFLHFLSLQFFFDFYAGDRIGGVVGFRPMTTWNLPGVTDQLELTGGIGFGYFMLDDVFAYTDDLDINIALGYLDMENDSDVTVGGEFLSRGWGSAGGGDIVIVFIGGPHAPADRLRKLGAEVAGDTEEVAITPGVHHRHLPPLGRIAAVG